MAIQDVTRTLIESNISKLQEEIKQYEYGINANKEMISQLKIDLARLIHGANASSETPEPKQEPKPANHIKKKPVDSNFKISKELVLSLFAKKESLTREEIFAIVGSMSGLDKSAYHNRLNAQLHFMVGAKLIKRKDVDSKITYYKN